MPRGSSRKRERQYEHIKESAQERGESTSRAEEIAARTVNKTRARAGESKTASKSSAKDISSGRRGGQRSHGGAGRAVRGSGWPLARLRCTVAGRLRWLVEPCWRGRGWRAGAVAGGAALVACLDGR